MTIGGFHLTPLFRVVDVERRPLRGNLLRLLETERRTFGLSCGSGHCLGSRVGCDETIDGFTNGSRGCSGPVPGDRRVIKQPQRVPTWERLKLTNDVRDILRFDGHVLFIFAHRVVPPMHTGNKHREPEEPRGRILRDVVHHRERDGVVPGVA